MSQIDFVITWVDGGDPEWQKEKKKYSERVQIEAKGNSDSRYRNCDNLQYWFRGIERHAPWVHKIYFVTWGHVPSWLNVKHPKLSIIRHEEYIPGKYLPTFSSHTIELNLHRIKGLLNQFVYFNDDMFLNADVKESVFFRNNLPCDTAALNVHCYSLSRPIQMIETRDVGVINEHFDFKESMKSNRRKWLNLKSGKTLLRTIALYNAPRFPGFSINHAPNAFLKSTLEDVWRAEYNVLDETCKHKFREMTDVNQWVFKEWQLAKGDFIPRSINFSKVYFLGEASRRMLADKAASDILRSKHRMICINDDDMPIEDFEYCFNTINRAFEKKYPDKSAYEL